MVRRKRNKCNQSSFVPDPAAMQRSARNVGAAFIRMGEALEKEKFGSWDQAIGSADRLHGHKLLNHQAAGGAVFKPSPPPHWSSAELLNKALGYEGATAREEAILALKRMGLRLWERHGAVIIAVTAREVEEDNGESQRRRG